MKNFIMVVISIVLVFILCKEFIVAIDKDAQNKEKYSELSKEQKKEIISRWRK